jgi:hypothetical protein
MDNCFGTVNLAEEDSSNLPDADKIGILYQMDTKPIPIDHQKAIRVANKFEKSRCPGCLMPMINGHCHFCRS